jgi:hemoglobin
MGAEPDLGERFVTCFVAAADDAGLPADPELRAALRSYMEWATAEVMSYQAADSVVPPGRAAPRWSWDGLQPADQHA